MHTTLSPRRELLLLLSLAGIQFTHIVDFMIMMPLGPQLTELFDISFAEFGLLVSAYTISAGISGLFATTFVDRFDRKHLLLTLYSLFALTTIACGVAPSFFWLMAARIAAGFFGGVLNTMSQTIIGDVIPFARRGRATGIVMTSFSVATVAGVPAGLMFANLWGWHFAFFAIGVMCLGVGALAFYALPSLDAHIAHGEDKHVFPCHGASCQRTQPTHGFISLCHDDVCSIHHHPLHHLVFTKQPCDDRIRNSLVVFLRWRGDLIHWQMDWWHYGSPWQA
jgi:predicted MFS family arabinose efflux permease